MSTNRVVITGLGAISSLGLTAEENWQSCVNGRTGVGPITLFDPSDYPFKVAAEVKNFDPADFLDRREARRWDRFEQLANIAANEAIAASGLEITEENSTRIGAPCRCSPARIKPRSLSRCRCSGWVLQSEHVRITARTSLSSRARFEP